MAMLTDFLKWHKVEKAKRVEIRDKRRVAKVFNDRYAYRKQYEGECAWMCPECNKLHRPVKYSILVGLIYPSCCSFGQNQRWSDGTIRTK